MLLDIRVFLANAGLVKLKCRFFQALRRHACCLKQFTHCITLQVIDATGPTKFGGECISLNNSVFFEPVPCSVGKAPCPVLHIKHLCSVCAVKDMAHQLLVRLIEKELSVG